MPFLLVAIQFFSMKTLYASLVPLHIDEKEGYAFFSAAGKDKDTFRVGYIDAKTGNSFPEVNNRDLLVYTSAVHQKQSVILYNDTDLSIYGILAGMNNGEEETKELMMFLRRYGIRYIVFFNNENNNMKGYSSRYVLNYQAIRRNLNGLFRMVYNGESFDVYSLIH